VTAPDVIIPAHNEESTVRAIIHAARYSGAVGAIVVVVDASTDATWSEALEADQVVAITSADKGSAIAAGLASTSSPLVLMLDADLDGLRPEHVAGLATYGPADGQVVGLRQGRQWAGNLPSLSGERRVPRAVVESVAPAGQGWKLEMLINAQVGRLGLPWRHLLMHGVTNPTKAFSDPAGLAWESLVVAGASLANLPWLVDYALHPNGRPASPDPTLPDRGSLYPVRDSRGSC
jgi:glycosyltransferase involved in cell wall biosynthesis